MPKKPTGQITGAKIEIGPSGVTGGVTAHAFPTQKDEIEQHIIDLWRNAMINAGASALKVTQNKENDFDFTVESVGGTAYLDLVEIVYPKGLGTPYKGGTLEINFGKFAEHVRSIVLKKSAHYGQQKGRPIDLLLYVTHFHFWPSPIVVPLIQHSLATTHHVFENVFLVVPFPDGEINLRVLFPSRDPLQGQDPAKLAAQDAWIMDMSESSIELSKDGLPMLMTPIAKPANEE
jgi:hypothetical protein